MLASNEGGRAITQDVKLRPPMLKFNQGGFLGGQPGLEQQRWPVGVSVSGQKRVTPHKGNFVVVSI